MRLAAVDLYRIRLPFRKAFEHASARRTFSENVLIRCTTTDGIEGWGETIARDYVTGDSIEGVVESCRGIPPACWDRSFDHADDVTAFCAETGLAEAGVARCAVELALLDALARSRTLRLDELLAADWPDLAQVRNTGPFRYSGPLGIGSPLKTALTAAKLRAFGVASVKLKLAGRLREDRLRLRIARAVLGARIDLRVDANESWTPAQAAAMAPVLRRFGVSAVEQPFHKSKLAWCEDFHRAAGIPVVFDESLCSAADARALAALPLAPVFAVKLAKLGGFRETLEALAVAQAQAIPVQISCQVGESAILSAAGRRLAALCPNLRYLEGSYDRFLLADNVTGEDISVGKGGLGAELAAPGLGIAVDAARVERLAVQTMSLFAA